MRGPRRAVVVLLAGSTLALAGCGIRERIPGFGPARDGVLLVRHSEADPQEIWVNDSRLGIAQPGGITCFLDTPTGTLRVESRRLGAERSDGLEALTRATQIVLPPEQPLLWDIDYDQVFSGRAHARLCGDARLTFD